jgi:hypothetical protein
MTTATATASQLKVEYVLNENQLSILQKIGAVPLFEGIINLSSVEDILNFTNLEELGLIWREIIDTEPRFEWKDLITARGIQILIDSIEFVQSREDNVGEELPQGISSLLL